MIGIVISDTFLVVGVWSEENDDLALHNVKQIDYTEPIGNIIHKEGDLNSVLGIALRSCLLYTSPSPRDRTRSRMPSSA